MIKRLTYGLVNIAAEQNLVRTKLETPNKLMDKSIESKLSILTQLSLSTIGNNLTQLKTGERAI